MSLLTPLTVLEISATRYASHPAFKIPSIDACTGKVASWTDISYTTLYADVLRVAEYWGAKLSEAAIERGSVVGLWIRGMTYQDVVHIYAIARAGYIPQLFSLALPSPTIVYELLQKAEAKALISDPINAASVIKPPVRAYLAVDIESLPLNDGKLPLLFHDARKRDRTFWIFHTSGSTSGSPKLVPCTYGWVDDMLRKSLNLCKPRNSSRQDVTVWIGSVCHMAQTYMLTGAFQHGSCMIQPTKLSFSTDELVDMIDRCSLNVLRQFGSFLGMHIRAGREDPTVFQRLRDLDDVLFVGLAVPQEEQEFALAAGVPLRNLFASTEVATMLCSDRGGVPLRATDGVARYAFLPVDALTDEKSYATSPRLMELVVLSSSPDCPHPSLRSTTDGHFHTGDLFEAIQPGQYIYRGRNDDWIKSENSLRCDTNAIETNIRETCSEMIKDCIVVGMGRPSPVLFVEPSRVNISAEMLKEEILSRTKKFHSRRYLHERITEARCIVVVPAMTLPRTATKGNIRRQAVEEAFRHILDGIFEA